MSSPHRAAMTRILALGVLGLSLVWSVPSACAKKQPRTDQQKIIDLLINLRPRWPEAYACTLVAHLPEKILKPLRNQSASTIGAYVVHDRLPRRVGAGPIVCCVSLGHGGGYMMLLQNNGQGYGVVWDSLLPVSVLNPVLSFQDLDGDTEKEIIISGQTLEDGYREWGIVKWSPDTAWVMAPRLDVEGKYRTYNRLIGRDLGIDSAGPAELSLLHPLPEPGETHPDTLRVFHYDPGLKGFIPEKRQAK